MNVSDRFLFFLREKKISQKEFCKITGYGVQSLSKFVNGSTSNPGVQLFILTAQHFPDVNIKWLMLGEGEMWNGENGNAGEQGKYESGTTSGLKFLGKAVNPELLKDLFNTKEELISTQKKRIEDLEAELKRCREGKSK